MKINSPSSDVAPAAVHGAKTDRSAVSAVSLSPAVAGGTPGVSVSMSATVRALEAFPASGEIDMVKVAAMREAIASGTFCVDAGAIADKLLSNAQEFLSRTRG